MKRHIITISGGLSSAYVAWWAKNNIDHKENEVVYYFNNTFWEHPDLYRFLKEISEKFEIEIFEDNDGRNPEQIFYDKRALGSNRIPICSRWLKADRLQKYIKPENHVYFGINGNELKRVARIELIYNRYEVHSHFPLVENNIHNEQINNLFKKYDIEIPELYKLGFTHNNCSGGCVRAGKKQWIHLYKTLPEVYNERMRVEKEVGEFLGKPYTYMKTMSLEKLKSYIDDEIELPFFENEDDIYNGECIGICNTMG